jgi:hypothetical protein
MESEEIEYQGSRLTVMTLGARWRAIIHPQ